jgi:hypothetical protein
MNTLDIAIKNAEALVVIRTNEIHEALNAKRYADKNNAELIAQLRQELENAEVRQCQAYSELTALYIARNAVKVGA